MIPAQTFVVEYIPTFQDFPPQQKPSKFNVADALEAMKKLVTQGTHHFINLLVKRWALMPPLLYSK
jgi:hypothetical protein